MKILCKPIMLMIFMLLIAASQEAKYAYASGVNTLQTLFYTPSQRAKIDAVRYKPIKKEKIKKSNNRSLKGRSDPLNVFSAGEDESIQSEIIVIDGYIKREDGKNVIWYNNTSTLKDNAINDTIRFKTGSFGSEGINVFSANKRIKLKAGQILEISSGKIGEQYKLKDSSAKVKIEKK